MRRTCIGLMVTMAAACGNGGGHRADAASDSEQADASADAPADAPADAAFNAAHRGTVQLAELGENGGNMAAGFYGVPSTAAGCTWTFSGSCSLTVCDAGAGLALAYAGPVTFTIGSATQMIDLGPTGYMPMSAGSVPVGTAVSVSAAGADVPPFSSATLAMPDALAVTAPSDASTIDHTAALALAWTPTTGLAYVNITERLGAGGAYPEITGKTIRCRFPSDPGSATVPAELMQQLDVGSGNVQVVVAGAAEDMLAAGDYDLTVRLAHYDQPRTVSVQ